MLLPRGGVRRNIPGAIGVIAWTCGLWLPRGAIGATGQFTSSSLETHRIDTQRSVCQRQRQQIVATAVVCTRVVTTASGLFRRMLEILRIASPRGTRSV